MASYQIPSIGFIENKYNKMYQWETLYKEKIKPSEMSTSHIKSVINLLDKKGTSAYSHAIGSLAGELKSRSKINRTNRYKEVLGKLKSGDELDRKYYRSYMNYIVKNPDLFQELINKHKIPVDVLVMYQDKILWSTFFWCNKNRMTDEYLMDIIESVNMTKNKWAMIIRILDVDEVFLNSIFDFIPPIFLIEQGLSFIFWKNNIHRIFMFDMNKQSERYRKSKIVWEKLIDNYKNSITASFIDRCKYYIPKEVWSKISQEIEFSDDYLISFKDYIDITKMLKTKRVSDKVVVQCRTKIDWSRVNYDNISDKVIVKLKDYVDWPEVFSCWHDQMVKKRTEEDRQDFKNTGDILKHKNFVDWEDQLVEWGLYTHRQLSVMNIMKVSRKEKYSRDYF